MHYSVEAKSKLLQIARHTIEKFLKNGSCATDILCGGCIGEAISVAQLPFFRNFSIVCLAICSSLDLASTE
jgi:hypothetical protein